MSGPFELRIDDDFPGLIDVSIFVTGAYQSQAVQTAGGPALLVMLYDRLAVDIDRAETSIRSGDPNAANSQLQHAQQIRLRL